ncbi:hypothetical protein Hdeb2414_s1255g00999721 [Helianthus debilis subsp. tardiflorus]
MLIKPFSLIKLSCMVGVRGTAIGINAWVEIVCAFIYFNVSMFWRSVLWIVSLITLPVCALAALHREKQLRAQLYELRDILDSLMWDRKELDERIRVAIKEHEMMEMMLGELEDEYEEAMHKIKILETKMMKCSTFFDSCKISRMKTTA